EDSRNNVYQLSLILNGELEDADRGVESMARSPWVAPALSSGKPVDIEKANSVMDRYKSAQAVAGCFLLDTKGKVVAASNSNSPESPVGNFFGLQPYFQKAISGVPSRYYTLEGTPGNRIVYTGYPVWNDQNKIIGVAVMRKDIGGIESDVQRFKYCYFVDPNGFVFLSSRADLLFKNLWPPGEGAVADILGDVASDGSDVVLDGRHYLVNRMAIGSDGWSVVLLSSKGQVWLHRLFCISITLIMCLLIIVFYTALQSLRESAGKIALSERRYYSLVEGSPNWVKLFDQEGRFVAINRSGLEIMGWDEADYIGKRFADIWPEGVRPMVEDAIGEVLQGARVSFEASCFRSDGLPLTWDVTLYPIYEEGGRYRHFVGISTDITGRKKAVEALRESEIKFRALYDSANDAIIIMDGLIFIDCNPKAMEMFGCERNELIGQSLCSFSQDFQPDGSPSEERAGKYLKEVLEGEPRYFHWSHRRMNGTLFETEISLNRIQLKGSYYTQAIFRDITRRKQREEQLRLHAAALQSAANAVVITDLEGRIIWINQAFSKLTGYTYEEAIEKKMDILKSGSQGQALYRELWETIFAGRVWHGEMQNRHKDGTIYAEEQTITPVRDAEGKITHFVAIKQDVTKRKQQEQQLSYLATHDPLTGLPNRRVLEDALKRAVARAGRGISSNLLFMDLDNFKLVNDTLGHTAGDQVLFSLTRVIQNLLRTGDLFVRFGGDEFAVHLENITTEEASAIAERMRREVEEYRFIIEDQNIHLSLSMGLVLINGGQEPGVVLSQADTAMYMAKEQGRNRVVIYRQGQEDDVLARLTEANQWVSRVKKALADERFVLYYQPLVRVSNAKVDHYEALIRMIGEEGDIIPPGAFIPAAERYGLMPQIDRWVFKQVVQALQKNQEIMIFMNVSGSSLADENFPAFVEEGMARSGVDPGRLGFEITETAVVQDMVAAEWWVRRIKNLGCRFALDDFGAGFNS
ncbi:MAG: bifunctional diguanylate cyclase/phosphodiesterase, partial [Desulfocucumaceae bacterium]